MGGDDLAEFVRHRPIDTDDRPLVELAAPKLTERTVVQGRNNLMDFSLIMKEVRALVKNLPDENSLQTEAEVVKARAWSSQASQP